MFDDLEKRGTRIGAAALARVAAVFGAEVRDGRVVVRGRRDDARLRWLGRLLR